jgi:cold shock protein
MKTGTVNWFNAWKGYGYIKPVDGGPNVYVHLSTVERAGLLDLKEGQKIDFEVAVDQRSGETFAKTLKILGGGPEETNSVAGELGGPLSVLSFARLLAKRRSRHVGGPVVR